MSSTTKKSIRLTAAQWAAVVAKWELGTHTLQSLSEEYRISLTAIKQGLNSRGAKRGVRAHEVAEEVVEQQKSDRQRTAELAGRMKEKYLKYTDAISSIAMRKLMEQHAAGKSLEGIKGEMETLRKAAAVLSTMRDENFHLLGLYKDDISEEELPEIIISELTAEELDAIQRNFETDAAVTLSDEDLIAMVDEEEASDPVLPFDDEEGAD